MQSNTLIYVAVALCYIDLIGAFTGPSSTAASRFQSINCNDKVSSKINLPRHRYNSILYAIDNDIGTISNTKIQTGNDNNSPINELSTTGDDNTVTKVGSSEYYQGFWSRSVIENQERVTGDAVLGPTLKLAGGISLILVGLIGVFLISNGII